MMGQVSKGGGAGGVSVSGCPHALCLAFLPGDRHVVVGTKVGAWPSAVW